MMNDFIAIFIVLICFSNESYTFEQTDEADGQFLTMENQNNNLLGQNDYLHHSAHYPESGYSDDYNDIDYSHDSIDRTSVKQASTSTSPTTKPTPALSALTLLGFLYFLGYIQDVLQGTSIRKKRDTEGKEVDGKEDVEGYLKSIEDVISSIEGFVQTETRKENELPNRYFIKDLRAIIPENSAKLNTDENYFDEKIAGRSLNNEAESGRTLEERADKIVAFFGNIMEKIPRFFGFNKKATARNDYDISNFQSESANPGFWSMFGSKVGQIATLMDFLGDPSPTRIGKRNTEVERDDIVDDQLIAQPSDLNAEDRNFLAPYDDNEDPYLIRRKRFTDGMNVWYSEVEHGRSLPSSEGIGVDGQILKMVFNLFKGALTT